jgi:hypothetical protein
VLYRVRIGRDEYLGSADEVVAFMARAEGAPARDADGYMRGVADRIRARMGIGVAVGDAESFLRSLGDRGVLSVEILGEPSTERVDPNEALGEGPVVLGPDVDPGDIRGL